MDGHKERYLIIEPNGAVNWILVDPDDRLEIFHRLIGCDWLENVYTVLDGIVIIIDGCGKIKDPPQPFNYVASELYAGFILVGEPIVGAAIVAAIHMRDGEPDWCPLTVPELMKLQFYLHVDLSQAGEVTF